MVVVVLVHTHSAEFLVYGLLSHVPELPLTCCAKEPMKGIIVNCMRNAENMYIKYRARRRRMQIDKLPMTRKEDADFFRGPVVKNWKECNVQMNYW